MFFRSNWNHSFGLSRICPALFFILLMFHSHSAAGLTVALDEARRLHDDDGDHLEFLEHLFQRLQEFGAVDPPDDDCTAIVMDMHGPIPGLG